MKQPATKSTAAKDAKPATGNSASTAKIQKFIMPVMGSVTFEYAKDKMVYSKTLEEWRTHSGIDIGGTKGANVKAVSDGIVSEIKTDPRYGNIVVIDHLNGIKTLYANLTSCDNVNPNQRIKQGEILGTIGDSASFESDEQSHLHFEVFKNNNIVNPLDYLPKN